MKNYDLVVIGGGPGGYVAAIRAAQLGMKVAVIEKEHLGGICLNWGCIPTKALLKVSEAWAHLKHMEHMGITVTGAKYDIKKVVEYSRNISQKLSNGVAGLLKKNKIDHLVGFAKLANNTTVEYTNGSEKASVKAKNIIIATGARPRELPHIKIDGEVVWNYKHALIPKAIPKRLLVIGSGAIGSEFASFYNFMGSDVTICDVAEYILPNEDREVSDYVAKSFIKRGIKVLTKSEIVNIEIKKNTATVGVRNSAGKVESHEYDNVISAVGVVANIENIGLEKTKIITEKGVIKVDEYLRTGESNIYAIGDVTPGPWLAHKASHEGIIAVEHMAGKKPHKMDKSNIPGCTYCYPQIASIGLTEDKAKAAGHNIRVGRFPLFANGKAIASSETEGFVKVIFEDKTGEILGAHMVGHEVTEMIQGLAIARTSELTEDELAHTIFPHPTISESMHEAVLDAMKRVIHI